jgi:ABC-type transport system involved in cytochrome bd biosynthesis fused ATPase/permease subunit
VKRLFTTEELRKKTNDENIHYYSQSRIQRLVGLIITFVIFVLLVLPVVAMYELTSVGDRNSTFDAVGILVVFTLLFSAAMSLLTEAKRHELFAASAAYCAVLVVFISNFNNNGGKLQ